MRRILALTCAAAVVTALAGCNADPNSGSETIAPESTAAELLPFESSSIAPPDTEVATSEPALTEEGPGPTDPPSVTGPEVTSADTTDPADTAEPADTGPTDATDPADSEPADATEPGATDTVEPPDTAAATTDRETTAPTTTIQGARPRSDPLCVAVRRIVSLNDQYQDILATALAVSPDQPAALSRELRKLPLTKIRNAYDDLLVAVPENLRRKVSTVRDYAGSVGARIVAVEDVDALVALVTEIESDPDSTAAVAAARDVSRFTRQECGANISP
jgi:hypothetical protein